jgi:hypothetical protein
MGESVLGSRARTTVLAAALVAVPLLLAGCGSGGSGAAGGAAVSQTPATNGLEQLTADQILAKTQAAAKSATSVVAKGTMGQGSGVDLVLGAKAADAKLTQSGQSIEIVRTADSTYIKGDAAFWTKNVGATAAKMFAGKYVKVPATEAAQFVGFISIASFFADALKPGGTVAKGDVTTLDGTKAITLKDTSDGSLMYISLEGAPLPLKIEKSGADGGAVTFTRWNQPVTVAVPPADQVLDFGSLTGG